jgi:hypothetical protein
MSPSYSFPNKQTEKRTHRITTHARFQQTADMDIESVTIPCRFLSNKQTDMVIESVNPMSFQIKADRYGHESVTSHVVLNKQTDMDIESATSPMSF